MQVPNYDTVTPSWLKSKIEEYGLTFEEFGKFFSSTRGDISQFCSGKRPISGVRKAAFYWFFEALKHT